MLTYISLEELKGLDDGELFLRWLHCEFPFDNASCGACLTEHAYTGYVKCHENGHQDLVRALAVKNITSEGIRPLLERLFAIRLFYKDLYTDNPPEIMESEVSDVRKTEKVTT